MKTRKPSRGIGTTLLGLAIFALTAYIAARLLLWLFPAELRMVGAWLGITS